MLEINYKIKYNFKKGVTRLAKPGLKSLRTGRILQAGMVLTSNKKICISIIKTNLKI